MGAFREIDLCDLARAVQANVYSPLNLFLSASEQGDRAYVITHNSPLPVPVSVPVPAAKSPKTASRGTG